MMDVSSAARAGCSVLPDQLRKAGSSGQLREIVLFLVIGGMSALIYMALNVALTTLGGLRPSLAILVTLALLIPPTYLAQRRVAFRSNRNHVAAFPRYIGTQLVGNSVALLGAELFPSAIRGHPLPAFAVIAVVVAGTSYGCLKFWTFRRPR
jgi:putative flippase GtrA